MKHHPTVNEKSIYNNNLQWTEEDQLILVKWARKPRSIVTDEDIKRKIGLIDETVPNELQISNLIHPSDKDLMSLFGERRKVEVPQLGISHTTDTLAGNVGDISATCWRQGEMSPIFAPTGQFWQHDF